MTDPRETDEAVDAATEEPTADAARVTEALDGNLCRCGAHRRIVDAVLAAREPSA